MKITIRSTDKLFSKYIRTRDEWVCNRCHRQHPVNSGSLHNSHYWSRGKESVRFDPENCIALCYPCHQLWGHGDEREDYKEFMIERLGKKGFKLLDIRAHTIQKRDDKMTMLYIKELIKELPKWEF
jgi:NAD-dependent dihydropyrimidine dehydrogenase PreA subunit